MATREENLKKINEELEKLDDEQLDKVAGGLLIMDSHFHLIRSSHESGNPNDPQNPTPKTYGKFLTDI